MAAIAGIWRVGGSAVCAAECERMLSALSRYGRDGRASLRAGDAALGCCFTRTLPEDAFDTQPITGANGAVVVADVRLDNRDELIRGLGFSSAWGRGASDAAVIAAALDRWDIGAINRFAGEYAIAAWDVRSQRLLLARDPLGLRPLCFHRGRDFFAFASMPRGLHALPNAPCAPNIERIAHLLALVPCAGHHSYFEGIERLEPGHLLTVTPNGLTKRRHWEPRRDFLRLKRDEDYAEALREKLDTAVRSCLRGTGGVATHLSGGLDSSAVTVTAALLQEARGKRVAAFTSAPRYTRGQRESRTSLADESAHAAAAAALYPNIDHLVLRGDGASPVRELDRNFDLYQKPLFNLCNMVWLHAIADEVEARGIRVLLTGAAGNATISYAGRELFAEAFRGGSPGLWWREASAAVAAGHARWRSVLAATLGPWVPEGWGSAAMGWRQNAAIHPDQASRFAALREANERPSANSWAHRVKWLRKSDPGDENKGLLARNGIEARDPTADLRLVEFCLSVPVEQYLHGGVPRSLLRRAMANRLPPPILEERRKGLQASDWHEGMTAARSEIGAELERLAICEALNGVLDIERLRRAVADWPRDGWDRRAQVDLYRSALLRGISAGHFVRSALAQQSRPRGREAVTA